MYYEYWRLHKPPFDNVPDPAMYVDCHVSLENAIADTLFAIEEGNECLAVIVGEVGLGKTLSLRLIMDSLDKDKYRIALVTNPGISFLQLMQEIIGQLTGRQCEKRKKTDLLELFNKLLFEAADEGKKVLIFIDEANAMSAANLESLRLLTNMQDDQRNLFTIILAGQMELARRLENPNRANLFQRIGTFSRIERIPSEEAVRTYIETRLQLAGGSGAIFTDDAVALIWEYSEHGTPRLINKIAKLCLKAGETNGFGRIDGEIVRQIGERFRNLTGRAVPKRKPRKRQDEGVEWAEEEEHISFASPQAEEEAEIRIYQTRVQEQVNPQAAGPEQTREGSDAREQPPGIQEPVQVLPMPVMCLPDAQPESPEATREAGALTEEQKAESFAAPEDSPRKEEALSDTVEIGGVRIVIEIPDEMRQKASDLNQEQRLKSAGFLAAQVLRKYPELTANPSADPIVLWSDIRQVLAQRLESCGGSSINAAAV